MAAFVADKRAVFPQSLRFGGRAISTAVLENCRKDCAPGMDRVNNSGMEIVSVVRTRLAEKIGPRRFDLWFGAARFCWDGATLSISLPNRFFLDFVRANFRRHIESACTEVLGDSAVLEFQVETSLSPRSIEAAHSAHSRQAACGAYPAAQEADSDAQATAVLDPPQMAAPPSAPRRRFASLDTFVTGVTNRLASATAEMAARRPGQLTPLMIYGPTGVGKTHLLEGIWTAARKRHATLPILYVTAEQFTSHFVEAVRGSGMPSFRRKYRGVGLLLVDDLQFLAGKRGTLLELLHTVDALLQEGRQVVVAADRAPADLAELGPELCARLQSGMICRIEPPDYATRLGIVHQMVRQFHVPVPPEVQQFVASRLTNHARELAGALRRLHATSEALGEPISLAMAEEVLAEMVRHSGRAVRLPDIEKAVCDVFGLDASSLQSVVKSKRVSYPRMLAMWLARKHTRAALSEIGQYFGHRTHSTVISAQKRVENWLSGGKSVDLAEQTWNIDDAIRQVEQRLRAG